MGIDFVEGDNDILFNQLFFAIIGWIKAFFAWIFGGDGTFLGGLLHLWDVISIIALFLAILFFIGYVYARIRFDQLSAIEMEQLLEAERKWEEVHGNGSNANPRWASVKSHIRSENPNDWRMAIVEADVLLEEVLTEAGYVGATIGDKLTGANASSFASYQDAWDAHKIRNQIAHEGGDFVLTRRVAEEAITKFERVFREFGAV